MAKLQGAIGQDSRSQPPRPATWLEKLHRLHEQCHFRGHDPITIRGGFIFQTLLALAAICASYIL